jgi:hypothetical protein
MDHGDKLPKQKMPADIELVDGSRLKVMLFVSPQGRVLDMLNDSRAFLPLESDCGEVFFVRKDSIRRVAPLSAPARHREERRTHRSGATDPGAAPVFTDPYELLRVSPGADEQEIREAYRQRCLENHPDRLQALGLSQEYVELATRRMALINAAFDQLKAARQQH